MSNTLITLYQSDLEFGLYGKLFVRRSWESITEDLNVLGFSIPDFDANVLLSYKTIFIMAPRRETVNFIELHQFWDETRVYFFLYRVSTLWFNIMDVSCCVSIVYLSWRLINISWKTEQAWIQYIIIIYAFTELVVNTSRLFRKYSPVSRYYELRWNVDTSCCDALRLIPW